MRLSISQLFVAIYLSFFALFADAERHGIPTSADQIRPILVGQSLPSLPLLSSQGTSFNLKAQLKKKPALLIFYRGGWCPYCNTHLANLRKIEGELLGLGIDIYAISPDYLSSCVKQERKINSLIRFFPTVLWRPLRRLVWLFKWMPKP